MSLQLEILTECYCTKIHSEKCPWSLLLFFFFFSRVLNKGKKKTHLEVATGETTHYFLGHQSNWFLLDIRKNKSSGGKLGIRAGCPGSLCNLHPWIFKDITG